MKKENEKNLLADIENLRSKLNKRYDPNKNAPKKDKQTYSLSCKLDKLILQYMQITKK